MFPTSISTIKTAPFMLLLTGLLALPNVEAKNRGGPGAFGNEIISRFNKCLPHIVHFPSELPIRYEAIELPFSHYAFNITSVLGQANVAGIQNIRSRKLNRRYHIDIPRHFRCFLVLLSTTYQVITDMSTHSSDLFWWATKQDTVLCSTSGSLLASRILANFFVYFIQSFTSPLDSFDWNSFTGKLYGGARGDLALVFVFLSSQDSNLTYSRIAAFYCHYCPKNQTWWNFSCGSNLRDCSSSMRLMLHSGFRRGENIPWRYGAQVGRRKTHALPLEKSEFCPLTLKPSSCGVRLRDEVVNFLLEVLNWTFIQQVGDAGSRGVPVISYDTISPSRYPIDAFIPGDSSTFRFITSDSVTPVGSSFGNFFLSPFDTNTWVCLGVTSFVIAIVLAAFSSEENLAIAATFSALSSFSVLVDQFGIETNKTERHAAFVRSVIVLPWLFVALVITNAYKGIMKSNYVLETTYSTPWESLSQMKGFAFIFAYDANAERIKITQKFLEKMKEACPAAADSDVYNQDCVHKQEPKYWATVCNKFAEGVDRDPCDFVKEARNFKSWERSGWFRKKLQIFNDVAESARLRSVVRLEEIIRNELSQPLTAFVSPTSHFQADWNAFHKVMESRPEGAMFVASEREEKCRVGKAFFLSSGLDEGITGFMQLRAATLMESGIYDLWKRWEVLRTIFGGPHLSERWFVEVSFSTSDIHMPFIVLILFLSVAALVFAAELLARKFSDLEK